MSMRAIRSAGPDISIPQADREREKERLQVAFRIAPWWWPVFTAAPPILLPLCLVKNRRYHENRARVDRVNEERIAKAEPLDLPELDFLELTVLVEWRAEPGFLGDAGVSYLFRSDRGAVLFDVGFGPARISLAHNATRLRVRLQDIHALVISHLHPDHMGGMKASRGGLSHVRSLSTVWMVGGRRCDGLLDCYRWRR